MLRMLVKEKFRRCERGVANSSLQSHFAASVLSDMLTRRKCLKELHEAVADYSGSKITASPCMHSAPLAVELHKYFSLMRSTAV